MAQRLGGAPGLVYALGGFRLHRPQFWLDKDRFVPLRLMLLDGKSLVDIQWLEWGTKTGGDWFPSVIEIRKDGAVVERCEVDEVTSGVSMPEDLFKL